MTLIWVLLKDLALYFRIFLVVLIGVGTGWLLTKNKGLSTVAPGAKNTAKVAGIEDTSTFKDSAEGLLEEGGVNGEGLHI